MTDLNEFRISRPEVYEVRFPLYEGHSFTTASMPRDHAVELYHNLQTAIAELDRVLYPEER